MDAFKAGILQRIANAEQDLHRAIEAGDEFLAEVEHRLKNRWPSGKPPG